MFMYKVITLHDAKSSNYKLNFLIWLKLINTNCDRNFTDRSFTINCKMKSR